MERLDMPWPTDTAASSFVYTRERWLEDNAGCITKALDFLNELQRRKLALVPFRKRSDVTLRMFEALEDAQAGVFLRLYVPHGRYQSEQFEDFLTMFSRYLRDVEGKEFSIDANRTLRGTTYIFKGRGDVVNVEELQEAANRFDRFLALSESDPHAATKMLEQAGISSTEAAFAVSKYARGLRRLNMEVRHEFQRRRLVLNQNLESELLDAKEAVLLPMPMEKAPSSLFAVVGNTAPVTINIEGSTLSGVLVQAINGNVNYTVEDKRIIGLIEEIGDKVEALRLRSELDRLKDKATQPEERRTAVQKLKSFLYGAAKYAGAKIDEVGTELLIKYLEQIIGGG